MNKLKENGFDLIKIPNKIIELIKSNIFEIVEKKSNKIFDHFSLTFHIEFFCKMLLNKLMNGLKIT